MTRAFLIAAALAAGACAGDLDAEWQLDHDRIVAVRATPPRILPGERAKLDMLIARKGDRPIEVSPAVATVVSPKRLETAVTLDSDGWGVTAPSAAALDAARAELMLPAGAPVPLVVGVAITETAFPSGAGPFPATKTVWLGESSGNPIIETATVDGLTADALPELVVGMLVDVPLSVPYEPPDSVRWLTSCGTMHDFDLPRAYLRVEAEDPTEGNLAVVVRTGNGGVAWRVWSIRAQ